MATQAQKQGFVISFETSDDLFTILNTIGASDPTIQAALGMFWYYYNTLKVQVPYLLYLNKVTQTITVLPRKSQNHNLYTKIKNVKEITGWTVYQMLTFGGKFYTTKYECSIITNQAKGLVDVTITGLHGCSVKFTQADIQTFENLLQASTGAITIYNIRWDFENGEYTMVDLRDIEAIVVAYHEALQELVG